MSEQTTQIMDDEIDLIELVRTILDGKLVIAGFMALMVTLGMVYFVYSPDKFVGAIPLLEPSETVMAEFSVVNETAAALKFETLKPDTNLVEGDVLFKHFMAEFNDSDELSAVIMKYSSKYQNFKGTEKQKNAYLMTLMQMFDITGPSKKEGEYSLSVSWDNEAEADVILNETLALVSENFNRDNLKRLNAFLRAFEIRINDQKEEAISNLKVAKQSIDLEIQDHILFLQEQAQIARVLKLADSAIGANDMKNMGGVSVSLQSDNIPFYLRGYKSIETERDLLLKRTKEQIYISNEKYLALVSDLTKLENDVSYGQFAAAVEASPFALNTAVMEVDTQFLELKNSKKLPLILVLTLLLGGLIGVVVVLVRKGFENNRARNG